MRFQIHSLPADPFAPLFAMTDTELRAHNACRSVVKESPGTPCRVSMEDARVGETVVLVNHLHQSADSPYRASHAIFIREGARQVVIAPGDVPMVLRRRLVSVRPFDADHMMRDAAVVDGPDLAPALKRAFADENIAYIHLHYAKPGCFAASVTRAT